MITGELIPEEMRNAGECNAVNIDLNMSMADICSELSKMFEPQYEPLTHDHSGT